MGKKKRKASASRDKTKVTRLDVVNLQAVKPALGDPDVDARVTIQQRQKRQYGPGKPVLTCETQQKRLWHNKYFKQAKKLVKRRERTDRALLYEVDRELLDDKAWEAREALLQKQNSLRRRETRYLQEIEQKLQRARARLATGRNDQIVRDEYRLRRLLDIFRAHLGPYVEANSPELDKTRGRSKKIKLEVTKEAKGLNQELRGNPEMLAVQKNDCVRQLSPHQDLTSGEDKGINLIKNRRRLDEIVAPHLDDSNVVHDVPPARKVSSSMSSHRESESDKGHQCISEEAGPQNANQRQSQRPLATAANQAQYDSYLDSPTQQTLKAQRFAVTRRQTTRSSPTRISGPNPLKTKTVLFEGPKQKYDCLQPNPAPERAEDSFAESKMKKKHRNQASRGSSSSEWLGKSSTPIPPPSIPSIPKIPSDKMQTVSSISSSVARRVQFTPTSMRPHTGQRQLAPKSYGGESSSPTIPLISARLNIPRSFVRIFPGSTQDDRVALEEEKKRWRSILGL
ncbi:hypothetical protein BKA67DRAFT_666960 [Truncatella angustata]|uniref:Uncharacterized protein n=1 Tax=Truncatella angustata TaxID=152316 RepID=A0A9P8UXC0_9PEZI|nr:uncharacterized protein BKA67DRAFT_666960 [Truncatella angustata]KAH6660118.1 hypothetical protein BKA67DRAFT_666960 [Truncatella angustata]